MLSLLIIVGALTTLFGALVYDWWKYGRVKY